MNAQAGPSRSQPPLHIDLDNIIVDQPRYSSPLATSASSTAPSLSLHRSSTQSAFYWGGLQTPRTERLSLTNSEWSISEEDVVSFGRDVERSISSVMLDDGKTGGWWVDLDKTPKASDPIFKTPKFPSRISSLPKQHPCPPSPKTTPRPLSPQNAGDNTLVALPDDSPLLRPMPADDRIPPLQLSIPPFNPERPPKKTTYDQLPTTPESLAMFPVPNTIRMAPLQPHLTEGAAVPPPPIPPRRSSRRERSGQVSEGKKPISLTSLVSLGPRPPPPRESSLRSASARAALSASATSPVITNTKPTPNPSQAPTLIKPYTALQQSPTSLSRQPRVRSRSAQLPIIAKPSENDRRPSYTSLSSILEDEQLPDMEATPEGSWSLRREELRLARSKSQPRMRKVRYEFGPWRLLRSSEAFCCV